MKYNIADLMKKVVSNNLSVNDSSAGAGAGAGGGAGEGGGIKLGNVKKKVDRMNYEVLLQGDKETIIAQINTGLDKSFLQIPAIGSDCLVYSASGTNYMSHYSKLDSIELLDNKDFVVKYTPLKEAIDILEDVTDSWKDIFEGWSPVTGDGGTALKTSFTANSSKVNLALTDFKNKLEEMKNKNLKQ